MTMINSLVDNFSKKIPSFSQLGLAGTIITMVISLIFCFFGYKLLKFFVALTGFLIGCAIGTVIAGQMNVNASISLVIALVIGTAAALTAFFLYKAGVFILTAAVSGLLAAGFLYERMNHVAVIAIAVIAGILIGVVSVYFVRPAVIVSSGLSGGFAFAGHLITNIIGKYINISNASDLDTVITLIAGIILAVLGMIYQFRHTVNKEAGKRK